MNVKQLAEKMKDQDSDVGQLARALLFTSVALRTIQTAYGDPSAEDDVTTVAREALEALENS